MNLKFSTTENKRNSSIVNFLNIKNLLFVDMNEFLYLKENKLIIVEKETSLNKVKKICKDLSKDNKYTNILFLSKKYEGVDFGSTFLKIYYPINIDNFKKKLQEKINSLKIVYRDVSLEPDNFIHNVNNNIKIYLTETEKDILKLLFNEKIVKKETLKYDILNFQPTLNTKSLESHLSRLRKKLITIGSKITIAPAENESVRIS